MSPRWTRRRLALAAIVTAGAGAGAYFVWTGDAPPVPQLGEATKQETAAWVDLIRSEGQDGDWLAIRGYHPSDHLVAAATFRPLSHAAILDLTRGEVIEAVAPRVRVVPLQEFVAHSHRFELIRPRDATTGSTAVERARAKLGEPYDFLGTIGLPSEKRSYCSELCAWASGIEVDRTGPHRVLHPADTSKYGSVIHRSPVRRLALPKGVAPQR